MFMKTFNDGQELHQALRHATPERLEPIRLMAERIRQVEPHPGSPTREVMGLFGDRWSALLMAVLATGRYRHAELHRVINFMSQLSQDADISQRMLTLRLRVLERDGLVSRVVEGRKAMAVEYCLTDMGRSLQDKLDAVIHWSADHAQAIRQAQQSFDEREAALAAVREGPQR